MKGEPRLPRTALTRLRSTTPRSTGEDLRQAFSIGSMALVTMTKRRKRRWRRHRCERAQGLKNLDPCPSDSHHSVTTGDESLPLGTPASLHTTRPRPSNPPIQPTTVLMPRTARMLQNMDIQTSCTQTPKATAIAPTIIRLVWIAGLPTSLMSGLNLVRLLWRATKRAGPIQAKYPAGT